MREDLVIHGTNRVGQAAEYFEADELLRKASPEVPGRSIYVTNPPRGY